MPSVQRAFTDFQGKKIKIFAISIDFGGAKDVKPFMAENHYTMPVLLDTKSDVLAAYGLFGTPGTFIADRQATQLIGGEQRLVPDQVAVSRPERLLLAG